MILYQKSTPESMKHKMTLVEKIYRLDDEDRDLVIRLIDALLAKNQHNDQSETTGENGRQLEVEVSRLKEVAPRTIEVVIEHEEVTPRTIEVVYPDNTDDDKQSR